MISPDPSSSRLQRRGSSSSQELTTIVVPESSKGWKSHKPSSKTERKRLQVKYIVSTSAKKHRIRSNHTLSSNVLGYLPNGAHIYGSMPWVVQRKQSWIQIHGKYLQQYCVMDNVHSAWVLHTLKGTCYLTSEDEKAPAKISFNKSATLPLMSPRRKRHKEPPSLENFCPAHHLLVSFTSTFTKWYCTFCGPERCDEGKIKFYGCRKCDYDVCQFCMAEGVQPTKIEKVHYCVISHKWGRMKMKELSTLQDPNKYLAGLSIAYCSVMFQTEDEGESWTVYKKKRLWSY